MSVSIEEIQNFVGKDVILHVALPDGKQDEREGVIKMATSAGIVFRPRGSSNVELVQPGDAVEVALAPAKIKPVVRKRLDPIELGKARQHLVDRHGVDMDWAKNANEQEAFDYHKNLDHSKLGHFHEVKPEKPATERDEALAEDTGDSPA